MLLSLRGLRGLGVTIPGWAPLPPGTDINTLSQTRWDVAVSNGIWFNPVTGQVFANEVDANRASDLAANPAPVQQSAPVVLPVDPPVLTPTTSTATGSTATTTATTSTGGGEGGAGGEVDQLAFTGMDSSTSVLLLLAGAGILLLVLNKGRLI